MNHRCASALLTAVAFGGLGIGFSACTLSLPFRTKPSPATAKNGYAGRKPMGHGLVIEMQSSPDPVKLGEVRELNVTLILRNVTKSAVTLKFPTTQFIEILIRNPNDGQVISQWSSERTFTSDPRLLVINPGERIQYNEPITTRELKPGTPYTLEAYVLGYEKELRVSKAILPQP